MADATVIGTAGASPFEHLPAADPAVYYAMDDGLSFPSRILIVKATPLIHIHF